MLAVGLYRVAPKWDEVTHDGDLAYMPAEMPSVGGEDLLRRAFPEDLAKSEFVLIMAREDGRFTKQDRKRGQTTGHASFITCTARINFVQAEKTGLPVPIAADTP